MGHAGSCGFRVYCAQFDNLLDYMQFDRSAFHRAFCQCVFLECLKRDRDAGFLRYRNGYAWGFGEYILYRAHICTSKRRGVKRVASVGAFAGGLTGILIATFITKAARSES